MSASSAVNNSFVDFAALPAGLTGMELDAATKQQDLDQSAVADRKQPTDFASKSETGEGSLAEPSDVASGPDDARLSQAPVRNILETAHAVARRASHRAAAATRLHRRVADPLDFAQTAGRGDVITLKRMLIGDMYEPATPDIIDSRHYEWGATALHLAAVEGAAECVLMLFEAGATIDMVDLNGHSALHLAAQNGHLACVRLLLQSGASTKMRDRKRHTPLMVAAASGHASCIQALVRCGASTAAADGIGETALMIAARAGHADAVAAVAAGVKTAVELDATDKRRWTAMMKAARQGHLDCIQVLLHAGADTKWADLDGFSALVYAAMWGHEKVISLLLAHLAKKRTMVQQVFGMYQTIAMPAPIW